MKKSILFVIPSLSTGGAEKSLVGLLKYWDYDKYDVDVYTFADKGEYASHLDKRVNIISNTSLFKDTFYKGMLSSVMALIKRGRVDLALLRVIWSLEPALYRMFGKKCTRNSRFDWYLQKKVMLKSKKHYDIAAGYMEGGPNYYVADCVDADVKIGWIHTDYSKVSPNVYLDSTRFEKMKCVVTVSENSKKEILKLMPQLEEKLCVIPNVIDTEKIDRMVNDTKLERDSRFVITSVGRLVKLKGFDIAVDAAKLLYDDGMDFKWYIVGDGEERENLASQIKELGLEERVILTGNTENPYSYINMADICVQLSEYEGRPLVVDEAQYLLKAVVASDIGAYRDLIDDGRTGFIVERNAQAVAGAIKKALLDEELLLNIKENIKEICINDKDISVAVEKLCLY